MPPGFWSPGETQGYINLAVPASVVVRGRGVLARARKARFRRSIPLRPTTSTRDCGGRVRVAFAYVRRRRGRSSSTLGSCRYSTRPRPYSRRGDRNPPWNILEHNETRELPSAWGSISQESRIRPRLHPNFADAPHRHNIPSLSYPHPHRCRTSTDAPSSRSLPLSRDSKGQSGGPRHLFFPVELDRLRHADNWHLRNRGCQRTC